MDNHLYKYKIDEYIWNRRKNCERDFDVEDGGLVYNIN